MKRIFSLFLSLLLWFSIVPLSNHYPTIVFATREGNVPASFIAVRLLRVGYDRDGSEIDPGVRADPNNPDSGPRFFPWEFRRGSSWGRPEVRMMTRPVFWFEIYLTVRADAGRSRPENRWIGVIDSHGQLWLDPDGHFHDSNYDRFSDPNDPAYIPGQCENNPRAQRDPASNTQGPYIIDPKNPEYKSEIYFFDRLVTGRGFRIGLVDLVDYPAADSLMLPDGTIPDGIVREGDWDVGMPLEKFINSGDDIADYGEEWHTEHIRSNEYYDLGEGIYRLYSGDRALLDPLDPVELAQINSVLPGDYRLAHISAGDGMETFNYIPGTYVLPTDRDVGMTLVPFQDDGAPVISSGEEWHSIRGQANARYDTGENIYLKLHGLPLPEVQVGDMRRTNVNTRTDPRAIAGGIHAGDLIVFAEVLIVDGGKNRYDLSVQTDVWTGVSPSVTTARLFSPNGDVPAQAQRIQKSTLLDPDGRTFGIPTTTFHDISIKHRSYIGVQIFADNGLDANLGVPFTLDRLYAQNASDDYRTGRTGEEFLGAVNGNYAFDFGRPLTNFQGNDFFFDLNYDYDVDFNLIVGDPNSSYFNADHFGCHTPVYRKSALPFDYAPTVLEDPLGTGDDYYIYYTLEPGDIRLTPVTLERGGQKVSYPANSVVSAGDLDVDPNYWLKPVPSLIQFYRRDVTRTEVDYQYGDPIYRSDDGTVNAGDIRLSEVEFGGMHYSCNSDVGEFDFWVRESPVRMITMGLSGDSRCFDMTVVPGRLDIDIVIDRPMKVEQTTQIYAKINTPLEKDQKVYLAVKEPVKPSYGGQRKEAFYTLAQLRPHDWLPIVPEGHNPTDYLVAPYPYDPTIRDLFGYTWAHSPTQRFEVLQAGLPWSNPRANGRDPFWWSQVSTGSIMRQIGPSNTRWNSHFRTSDYSPASAPRRGPYPFYIPSPRETPGRFEFPFDGTKYRQLWIYPFPAVSLFNGQPNKPWYFDNDPTMKAPYQIYNMYTRMSPSLPTYGNTPFLTAYSEFNFYVYYLYLADLYPTNRWIYLHYADWFERCFLTISPARFSKAALHEFTGDPPTNATVGYYPGSQTAANHSPRNFGSAVNLPPSTSFMHFQNPYYYHADHFGAYLRDEQLPGNGVYAYLDETSTPRRVVVTWRVNHGYDFRYRSHFQGIWNVYWENTSASRYAPYNVQMVLEENGSFQYNYDGGNRWWGSFTSDQQDTTNPMIGFYGGRPGLRQIARIGYDATEYNWAGNNVLTNAPSVRWGYTELPGIDESDEKRLFVDYRELDRENQEVTFQYTPYRGTCNEDGTRTRLEITAFLDNGGYTNPVPLTPLSDVVFDVIGPKVGTFQVSDTEIFVYVDIDGNRITSEGDIRLTRVTWMGQTYAQGTLVQTTDTDYNIVFNQYDLPIGGAIYDGALSPQENGKILVYVDMNRNGIADLGDVRLVAFATYEQGSVVVAQQWEVFFNNQVRETILFPANSPLGVMNDGNGVPRYVYWDRDASQTLTRYDIRLVAINSYEAGSMVLSGDADIGTPYSTLDAPLGVVNPMYLNPEMDDTYTSSMSNPSSNHSANVYVNMGTVPRVKPGDIRLTRAYIMDGTEIMGTYPAGSIVREGDFDDGMLYDTSYLSAPIIEHFSHWGRGIYLDLDGDGLPSTGDIRLTTNRFTQAALTSFWAQYPDLSGGPNVWPTWVRLIEEFPPGSIVQFRGTTVDQSMFPPYDLPNYFLYYSQRYFARPYSTTADNVHQSPGNSQWYTPRYFLTTPGVNAGFVNPNSPPSISVTADNNVYLNRSSSGNAFVTAGDIRLTEIGRLQQGTPVEIDSADRQSHFLYDPFWARHPWSKLDLDENPFKALHPTPQAGPDPLIPPHIYNGYDLYAWEKYDIAPEDLTIETDKECLSLYEQRFPNLAIRMIDADNPHDINDPANIVVSGDPDERLIMNFNAHGGGIKFLFTAIGQPPSYQKYIGQYNIDGTVVWWYWYDNAPYGVLDPNDFLRTRSDWDRTLDPFKPKGGNPDPGVPVSTQDPPFPARIWDIDCSVGQTVCSIPGDRPGFPALGEINNRSYEFAYKAGDIEGLTIWNHGDHLINQNGTAPSFDGTTPDMNVTRWRIRGDRTQTNIITARAYGTILSYGIPIQLTPYTDRDDGGRAVVPVYPTSTDTPVTIRVYSARVMYDYNSRYPMGPAFINDMAPGIDYVGIKDIPVLDPDPKVNFGEFQIIDHALQNSKVHYTAGGSALSPMVFPSPRISADYDPILKDLWRDVRAYPGGQTHTGRVHNHELYSGFNAYPAIWQDMYNKLGTEMMPFTDYGIYFILNTGGDAALHWTTASPPPDPSLALKAITIEGPFMTPRVHERLGGTGALTRALKSNYPDNLPVQYDFSGKIVIDVTNFPLYSSISPPDFTNLASPMSVDAFRYRHQNERLLESKKMWYYGRNPTNSPILQRMVPYYTPNPPNMNFHTIHWIDEIIPIGPGKISITVELQDGTIRKYQDCCHEIFDDIPVHGLEIETNMETIEVDNPTRLEVLLKEHDTRSYPRDQHEVLCNDALVFLWQDRGIKDAQGAIIGAGDGWVTVPPRSSYATGFGTQISHFYDLNNDGKISFNDWETEIIGTYDLASNTWHAGVIDARTYSRNNGIYSFDLNPSNGALIDTVGMDFGGPTSTGNLPDNVIDDYELLPVYVTAYKFGDDNNDRAFTPLYSINQPYEFSHEVYMAGMKPLSVVPKNDLIISFGPDPLTAGCVPELLENQQPLTFTVLDADGYPVDLTRGLTDARGSNQVDDESVWNVLFKDPHPCNQEYFGANATLPQYYWLRTDLHNDDGTLINNYRLYSFPRNPFQPISMDFSRASEGIYAFEGFCANDEGSFKVFVDTPDRRRRGVVDVRVVLPEVQYAIGNRRVQYSQGIPINPDFVMTAANISEYNIIAVIRDAQGNPIRGVASEICDGGEKIARFTPYVTKPDNFNYYGINQRYYNQLLKPHETREGSAWILTFQPLRDGAGNFIFHYNTTNWQWENGNWELATINDLPPAGNFRGFGRGAIYNSPHREGYLFAPYTINAITEDASFEITDQGYAGITIGFNDIGYYGGLIGKNPYSNSIFGDLGGGITSFMGLPTNPGMIRYRYNQFRSDASWWSNRDGYYRLDWDAFPSSDAKVGRPVAEIYDASTNRTMGKNLMDPANYDLIYGKINHLKIILKPASPNDLGIFPQGTVIISDDAYFPDDLAYETKAESMVYAVTNIESEAGFGMNSTVSGVLRVTPTGSWRSLAQLKYYGFRAFYGQRYMEPNARVWNLANFDVVRALEVEIKTSQQLVAGETGLVMVLVRELGTKRSVSDASVRISGAGIQMDARTDREGVARFNAHPTTQGILSVRVSHSQLGEGYNEAHVIAAPEPNEIILEASASRSATNEAHVDITGRTNPGNTVTVNNQQINVQQDGRFETRVNLVEGSNEIIITATDRLDRTARKILIVTRRTQGPSIFVEDVPPLVDAREYLLQGKVTPGSTLKANGKLAEVTGEDWKVMISLDFGKNQIKIDAVDEIGNLASKEIEITVFHKVEVKLAIGSKQIVINGIPSDKPLDVAPYIQAGNTFVPLRVLSEAFGARVQWLAEVRGIVIELMGNKIEMQIGSSRAIVNGRTTEMNVPPEITQGVTFVPLRFVADILGAETQWIQETREIVVTLLTY